MTGLRLILENFSPSNVFVTGENLMRRRDDLEKRSYYITDLGEKSY